MGLDTSHDCWHGPYSSFHRFRRNLAQRIGVDLDEYIGYSKTGTKELSSIEHDIMPLLNHSDCDGILTPEEAGRIAKGLQQILDSYDESIPADWDMKDKIEQFRDGCLEAARYNETIDFH